MKDAGSLAVLCITSSPVLGYRRKKPILNEGAVLLFQGSDTILAFLCYLLVFKARTSMLSVLGLLDSTSPGLQHWGGNTVNSGYVCQLRTIWMFFTSGKQMYCAIPVTADVPWDSVSTYLLSLMPHLYKGGLCCTWLIRLIWVLIWEHGPRTHLQCWDFTTQLHASLCEEFSLFPEGRAENASQWHEFILPRQRLL